MADEAYRGYILLRVRLQCGIDVALPVHLHVAEAFCLQLVAQELGEYKLLACTRHGLAVFGRLCVELHIIQESFCYVHISIILLWLKSIRQQIYK